MIQPIDPTITDLSEVTFVLAGQDITIECATCEYYQDLYCHEHDLSVGPESGCFGWLLREGGSHDSTT